MGGLFHKLRHSAALLRRLRDRPFREQSVHRWFARDAAGGVGPSSFLPKYEHGYAAKSGLDANDFAGYVRGIIPATATSNEVFGFKLMGWYLQEFLGRLRGTQAFGGGHPDEDLEMLRNAFPQLQFIQIVRHNKVRQAVSKARAAQTGLWKIQEGNSASGEARFDPDLIANCLEDTRREELIWTRFLAGSASSRFWLSMKICPRITPAPSRRCSSS